MKASWNWLTDYVPLKASVAELSERLIMAGLIVEEVEETAEDIVLTVEITSNRPDWLSHLGIAREIAGLYGQTVRVPKVDLPAGKPGLDKAASLEVLDFTLCPLYTGRVIRGVRIAPSPSWLAERVEAVGLRPVNNVVDITNFVMYECGQPLHAFDLNRIGGGKVVVRSAKAGEFLTLIDGSKKALKPGDCVIADAAKPIALAGVMGGIESEISPDTVDIFLESARFDQYSTRIAAKRLGISTDASYRFERGVDAATVDWASRRCCQLILEFAGGALLDGVLKAGSDAVPDRVVTLRRSHLARLLGMDVPSDAASGILTSLGFTVRSSSAETTSVIVPSFRGDVKEEADLVEEVARIYGYDKIPVASGISIAAGSRTRREQVRDCVESVLTAAGYYGSISFSLMSSDLGRKISPWTSAAPVYIENRAGQENAYLRRSLIPSLLAVRKTNEDHKVDRPDLYEIAHVYLATGAELPDQPLMASAVTGDDFAALKGVVEKALTMLDAPDVSFVPACYDFLAAGEAADVMVGGRKVGCIGRINDAMQREVDLRAPVVVAEIDLTSFEEADERVRTYAQLARFPGIDRDIAVVIPEEVTWADMLAAAAASGAAFVESVSFVSIYRGKPIPEGQKSLALRVVFRSGERTLTSAEADAEQAKIVRAFEERFGARLR
jgi:phenylalanyl-tRNA synthetase beta chain